jgi:hypothetical protein
MLSGSYQSNTDPMRLRTVSKVLFSLVYLKLAFLVYSAGGCGGSIR